ncbi:MAG TPA: DUF58 domain-containing protein [Nocardioidaceae bacterium]|nr:DUF58 domain-containing protein [Nocardioidaceae bacterium]
MREALSAMTTRGRAFVAAGLTALACAVVLGQDDLLRVGALLALLPVVTAFFVGRSRYRLGLVRSISPNHVTAGKEARVQLDLTNDGRMPTGMLLLEDQVPYVLGTRPRFVVDRMGTGRRRTVGYVVRSDVRGKYTIGPLSVRLSDPFGLVELNRTFSSTASLVVVPRVVPLPPILLSGAWTGSGDNRPRAFASGSAEDVTVREYHQGDDLRRVHWRSSARVGELMVRREEQPWQSRATLFLDNRQLAHRGRGAASSLEHAVSVAASIAVHLVQRGFVVRLVTASGDEKGGSWHERGSDAGEAAPLLESLAVVTHAARPDLDTKWLQDPGHSGLLVAVVGGVDERDKAAFARMRHTAATAMAVALDVDAWAGAPRPARDGRDVPSAAWLRAQGWQTVGAAPGSPLSSVWQELGLTAGLAGRNGGDLTTRGSA